MSPPLPFEREPGNESTPLLRERAWEGVHHFPGSRKNPELNRRKRADNAASMRLLLFDHKPFLHTDLETEVGMVGHPIYHRFESPTCHYIGNVVQSVVDDNFLSSS